MIENTTYNITVRVENSIGISDSECYTTFTTLTSSSNLLANPSFEETHIGSFHPHYHSGEYLQAEIAIFWEPFFSMYVLDGYAHSGARSISASSHESDKKWGFVQYVHLNHSETKSVFVSGWSSSLDVSGIQDDGYALHFDLLYQDGSFFYGTTLDFPTGTNNWNRKCISIYPAKPLKGITVFATYTGHTGQVWFDDFVVSDTTNESEVNACSKVKGGPGSFHGCCPNRSSILSEETPVTLCNFSLNRKHKDFQLLLSLLWTGFLHS